MKIRWKASLALLLFLSSIILTLFIIGRNSSGPTLAENTFYHLLFLILALVEVCLFTIGTFATEKKITTMKFSFLWLILFSLIVWLITTVVFEIPAVIMLNTMSLGEGALAIVYFMTATPIVALASVLIFITVPSIVFSKIIHNKRNQRFFSIGFLVLTGVILIFALLLFQTCDFGHSMRCIGRQARNDLDICEQGGDDFSKCRCYSSALNAGYDKDLEICYRYEHIDDYCQDEFNICVRTVAINANNPDFCNAISEDETYTVQVTPRHVPQEMSVRQSCVNLALDGSNPPENSILIEDLNSSVFE